MKFWAAWREEDITDAQMYAIRNHPLSTEQIDALFAHRPPADRNWYQQLIAAGELAVSGQDKLLISLLSPERLLEMTRFFTLFDKRTAKLSPSISRYSVLKTAGTHQYSQVRRRQGRWCYLAYHGFRQILHHGVPQ